MKTGGYGIPLNLGHNGGYIEAFSVEFGSICMVHDAWDITLAFSYPDE